VAEDEDSIGRLRGAVAVPTWRWNAGSCSSRSGRRRALDPGEAGLGRKVQKKRQVGDGLPRDPVGVPIAEMPRP
jgi:hypothetical protein